MKDPLPSRMAAAVLTGHGGLDKLEYHVDWPVPEPAPGDVLIRVAACGVNNTDINTRTAWYGSAGPAATEADGGRDDLPESETSHASWGGQAIEFPRIQGADIVGRVVAVGEGVADHWLGVRVMVDPWVRDPSDPLNRDHARFVGSELDGGFAQFVCIPQRNVRKVQSDLGDEELASFACAYLTAELMLTRARLSGGETVIVTGASGGVGSALVQLARRRGATVLALAAKPKARRVRELGANAVYARDTTDLARAVRKATGRASVDLVADVVGGEGFGRLIEVLCRGGRYVTAGAIAGPMVTLDLRTLYLKDLELIGATVATPEIFANLVRYIESGELQPRVAKTYPLAEIGQAQSDFLTKSYMGKLVLLPPVD